VFDDMPPRREMTWLTDPAMLLAGEDPASREVRDAVHWIRVFRELIDMTSALLERSESAARVMHHDAVTEVRGTQRLLREQRAQYLARYDFWQGRAAALSRHAASPAATDQLLREAAGA